MRKQVLCTAAAWATGTCGLLLAMFLPASLQADSPLPAVLQPVLQLQGAQLSLRLENAEAGQFGLVSTADATPTLLLVARNPTDKEVELHPTIDVSSSGVSDFASRVPRLPKSIWRRETSLTLAPHSEQTARVRLDTLLPAGQLFTARLEARPQGVNALTFRSIPALPPAALAVKPQF